MDLRIATIAERPAMKSRFVNEEAEPWPAFMNEDPIAWLYFSDVRIAHPEYGLIAYDADDPDQAVARAFCVPFAWDGDPALGARSPDRAEAEPGLGAGDHRSHGPAGHRPVREDAGGNAGQRETSRVQGSDRPGAAEPQAPGPGHADRGVRGAAPRGRPARGSVAACSRPGRRPGRWHLQARDGHPRHPI